MSTPASADAPPSEARGPRVVRRGRGTRRRPRPSPCRGRRRGRRSRGAPSSSRPWAGCRPASVVPSRFTTASGRSTRAPGIVPETVPSKWTADASRVAWSERASISLGSVTFSGGIAGASGPTPSTVPAPRTTSTRTPITARPAKTPDLDIGSLLRGEPGAGSGVVSCRDTGSPPKGRFGQTAPRPACGRVTNAASHVTMPEPVRSTGLARVTPRPDPGRGRRGCPFDGPCDHTGRRAAQRSRRTSTATVMPTWRSAPRARRFAGRSPMPAWCT